MASRVLFFWCIFLRESPFSKSIFAILFTEKSSKKVKQVNSVFRSFTKQGFYGVSIRKIQVKGCLKWENIQKFVIETSFRSGIF